MVPLVAANLRDQGHRVRDEHGWLVGEGESVRDVGAVFVNPDEAVGHEVDVALCVDAAGDGEPRQLQRGEAVVAGVGVTAGQDGAALDAADTRVEVDRGGEGLGGELVARHVWQAARSSKPDGANAEPFAGANTHARRHDRATSGRQRGEVDQLDENRLRNRSTCSPVMRSSPLSIAAG